MSEGLKKIIIVSVALICVVAIFAVTLFTDLDLNLFQFTSVKSLMDKRGVIENAEADLVSKQSEYDVAVKKVKDAETTFESEKTKYESISDDTLNVIKEATTEENYDLDYLWIRLGNYAKRNNLQIIMTEPGGVFAGESANNASSTDSTTSSSNTTTTETTTTSQGEDNTTEATTIPENTDDTTAVQANEDVTTQESSNNTLFSIQITGSYLNISDFIFDVENDEALRFKLDNISIDYVSGTTIKAKFDVKNLIINK